MNIFTKITHSNFFIKLRSWEFWPFGIVQFPTFIYWLLLSLKERSLFFFSASNPGILTGGMFGESKYELLMKIPEQYRPACILIRFPASLENVQQELADHHFTFPVIFKPDIGERGRMVRKINNTDDVKRYLSEINSDFIIQEFVDLPLEFGVFYVRHPESPKGKIVSVTAKEMLHVIGDGKKPLRALIMEKDRAKLQWPELEKKYSDRLDAVVPESERVELVSIGNHCLGTTFLNGNHLISSQMAESFDRISKPIDGFYFGRYDLRTASEKDLEQGNVKVMELNGCGAEPSHIYHPGASLFKALGVLLNHLHTIYRISAYNHRNGTPYLSFAEGLKIYKRFKAISEGK